MKINLDAADISHILTLLANSEQDGSYYGVRAHYEKRRETVRRKLLDALHAKVETP